MATVNLAHIVAAVEFVAAAMAEVGSDGELSAGNEIDEIEPAPDIADRADAGMIVARE